MAFKAMLVASQVVRKGFPGKTLAVLPSKHTISLKSGIETQGFMLEVRAVPEISPATESDASVGGDSNAGTLSVYMSQMISEKNKVAIGTVGPSEMYSVLKAAVYAQDNMAAQERAEVQFALVPKFRKVTVRGKELTQMIRVQA